MNCIKTSNAPLPVGPYSQAVEAGGVIYCSGMIGLDPKTSAMVDGGVEEQTVQVLKNLAAVLKEAGSGLEAVVRTTIMLRNMADFSEVNRLYSKIFSDARGEGVPMPARTTYAVAGLPANALIEIDCIALQVIAKAKGI